MAGSPKFGRIDALCWVVVVPMVAVSVVLIVFVGLRDVGIGLAVLAVLLLVFDSWANRPRPELDDEDGGRRPSRTPPPANRQRPAQQQQRQSRAPQQRQQSRQPQRPQQRPRRPQARR